MNGMCGIDSARRSATLSGLPCFGVSLTQGALRDPGLCCGTPSAESHALEKSHPSALDEVEALADALVAPVLVAGQEDVHQALAGPLVVGVIVQAAAVGAVLGDDGGQHAHRLIGAELGGGEAILAVA